MQAQNYWFVHRTWPMPYVSHLWTTETMTHCIEVATICIIKELATVLSGFMLHAACCANAAATPIICNLVGNKSRAVCNKNSENSGTFQCVLSVPAIEPHHPFVQGLKRLQ